MNLEYMKIGLLDIIQVLQLFLGVLINAWAAQHLNSTPFLSSLLTSCEIHECFLGMCKQGVFISFLFYSVSPRVKSTFFPHNPSKLRNKATTK